MSLHALATGLDHRLAHGAEGRFITALLRVAAEDKELILISVIAFADEAERLIELGKGDAIAVSGRTRLNTGPAATGSTPRPIGRRRADRGRASAATP